MEISIILSQLTQRYPATCNGGIGSDEVETSVDGETHGNEVVAIVNEKQLDADPNHPDAVATSDASADRPHALRTRRGEFTHQLKRMSEECHAFGCNATSCVNELILFNWCVNSVIPSSDLHLQ